MKKYKEELSRADKSPMVCPRCGKKSFVQVIYGFPGGELFEKEERGEVILGGCTGDCYQPYPDGPLVCVGPGDNVMGCVKCGLLLQLNILSWHKESIIK